MDESDSSSVGFSSIDAIDLSEDSAALQEVIDAGGLLIDQDEDANESIDDDSFIINIDSLSEGTSSAKETSSLRESVPVEVSIPNNMIEIEPLSEPPESIDDEDLEAISDDLDAELMALFNDEEDFDLSLSVVSSTPPLEAEAPSAEEDQSSEAHPQPMPPVEAIQRETLGVFSNENSQVEIDFDEEDADDSQSPGAILSGPPQEVEAEAHTKLPQGVSPSEEVISSED